MARASGWRDALVDRRAYAPSVLEHAVLVEPGAREVPVDVACDHEGVGVLRKTPQPVHERAGLIFEILLLMEPLGPSASHAASGEASPAVCSRCRLPGEVPVRLLEMSIGAEKVEPLRHVESVASADDDKIRFG